MDRRARATSLRCEAATDGVLAFVPRHGEEVLEARAWLGWLELWRVEDCVGRWIEDSRAEELGLLAQLADHQLLRAGARLAAGAHRRTADRRLRSGKPMRPERARTILAAACHNWPAPDVYPSHTTIEEDSMSITHDDPATRARPPASRWSTRSLLATIMKAYSRRKFGLEAEPMQALLHQRKVLTAVARFGMRLQKWSPLDSELQELAMLVGREPDRVQLVHGLRLLRVAHQRDADREAGAGDDAGARAPSTRRWSARSWSTPRR